MSIFSQEINNHIIDILKNDVANKIKLILRKEKEAFASLDFSYTQKRSESFRSSRNKRNMLKSLITSKCENKTFM